MTDAVNDIPKDVIQETDAYAERILSEWNWLEGWDVKVRNELRDEQNKLLALEQRLFDEEKLLTREQVMELRENITVLSRKIKRRRLELLETL